MKSFFLLLFLLISLVSCDETEKILSLPTVTTTNVNAVSHNSANCICNILSDGGATITERGICWSNSTEPTISDNKIIVGGGIGIYNSSITELTLGVTYYVRAYAINSKGVGYGSILPLNTIDALPTVKDNDGNIYHYLTIGTQTWMIENLKTTKYNDGTNIPLVTDGNSWSKLKSPAYCFYNNEEFNKNIYGGLYNWYAINTGKLAPLGWHIPSANEWTTLENYLKSIPNNGDVSNNISKSLAATTYWASPVQGVIGAIGDNLMKNNRSGFSALPGGCKPFNNFTDIVYWGHWWTSTEVDNAVAHCRTLYSYYNNWIRSSSQSKIYGLSVRCVKD